MSTTYTVGVRIDGNAAGLARASKEAQAHVKQMGAGSLKEFTKMAKARELLGVRPEREIQREIMRTEAAYNRLARSGSMSFNEQRRAAAAMRAEVSKLNSELGKMTTQQKIARGLTLGGGAAAAGLIIAPTVRKTMAYDLRLAHLANTEFAARDKAGRRRGRDEIDAKINEAVQYGGGTRESALSTRELLAGSGVFTPGQTDKILREAVKAATANNADPENLAQMAVAASQTMGIKPEQMSRMFGMATFAGQSGGFEIKDMAKWLSPQMAGARNIGMYGEAGFAKLAAVNQAAVATTGTKEQAGNAVVNLIGKIGSQDTAKDFKKLGIDLPRQLAEGRMKGLDAFDVLGNLLQGQLGKDKNYQRVQTELLAAKNDVERAEKLKAVGDIAQGTIIGKVFQDREALMALFGFINDRERVNSTAQNSQANADTAVTRNFDVISDTASFKADQAVAARDAAFQKTIDKMMPALGGVADGLTSLMTQYPGYTTAVAAVAAAVTGLAGAAGLAALALGKGGLPGGMGLPSGGAGGPGKAGGKLGLLKGLGKAGGVLGLIGLMGDLFFTSDADMAVLNAADAMRNSRGRGFTDPRIIGSGGVASAAALERSLRATEVKGEITVRVTAAPGISVGTSVSSNSPRITMRSLGQTNLQAGY